MPGAGAAGRHAHYDLPFPKAASSRKYESREFIRSARPRPRLLDISSLCSLHFPFSHFIWITFCRSLRVNAYSLRDMILFSTARIRGLADIQSYDFPRQGPRHLSASALCEGISSPSRYGPCPVDISIRMLNDLISDSRLYHIPYRSRQHIHSSVTSSLLLYHRPRVFSGYLIFRFRCF